MRGKIISISVVFLTVLLAFGTGGGLTYYFLEDSINNVPITNKNTQTTGVIKCSSDITIDETGISVAVGKIYDATVTIQNYQNNRLSSTGSGFIYKKDNKYGYILTNHHVISETNKLIVTLSNDDQVEATVLGSDKYLDLAVIRIDVDHVKQVATIGTSEKVSVGDTIFTVGSPIGYEYRGSVTKGTLSGKNRMVTVSVASESDWIMNVLQIDAAINPGNSGGPLLNINGEVIGINSLKLVEDEIEGMGFALPIEYALAYTERLEKGEEIVRPMLGVQLSDLNNLYVLYSYRINVDPDIKSGVVLLSVERGSSAEEAGLEAGDVITKINDSKVTDSATFRYNLYKYSIGDTITVTYNRNGTEQTTKIKLEDKLN